VNQGDLPTRAMLKWVTRSPVRMLIVIAVLVGLPVMVLAQNSVNGAQAASNGVELARVGDGAQAGAEVVARRMGALLEQTQSIALNEEVRAATAKGDQAELERELADILRLYVRDARRIFVLDVAGRFVASAPAQQHLGGTDFSRTDYFLAGVIPWRTFVSQAYLNESFNTPDAIIAAPILDANGAPIGLLCAVVDLSQAEQWLAALTLLYDEIYVVDDRGRLIFGEGVAGLTQLRDLSADPNVALALKGRVVTTEADDLFSGARRFIGSGSVTGVGWIVFATNSPAHRRPADPPAHPSGLAARRRRAVREDDAAAPAGRARQPHKTEPSEKRLRLGGEPRVPHPAHWHSRL